MQEIEKRKKRHTRTHTHTHFTGTTVEMERSKNSRYGSRMCICLFSNAAAAMNVSNSCTATLFHFACGTPTHCVVYTIQFTRARQFNAKRHSFAKNWAHKYILDASVVRAVLLINHLSRASLPHIFVAVELDLHADTRKKKNSFFFLFVWWVSAHGDRQYLRYQLRDAHGVYTFVGVNFCRYVIIICTTPSPLIFTTNVALWSQVRFKNQRKKNIE